MPAYVVMDVDVTDPARYEGYLKLGDLAAEAHGARFLVRGGAIEPLEGGWSPRRMAILEFPDAAAARAWNPSPECAAARNAREGIARFRAVLVAGVSPS